MSKLKKEIKRFLVAGLSAVGIDLISYYTLLGFLQNDIAKTISFFLGTLVAYTINKYWTFEKYEKSYKEVFQFGALYSLTLFANVLTNHYVLDFTGIILLSFLCATGLSTVLNFLGQKFWVFK